MRATIRKLSSSWAGWLPYLAILVVSILYWAGLAGVPFHPDESTQIFMSADFDTLFRQPLSLAWSPAPVDPSRQLYRLLDAPLTRDLIGAGRLLAGLPATPLDWDWSQTYAQNAASGALPDPSLLLVGRAAVAFLFPFSLLLSYWIGRRLKNRLLGWIFWILVAANALVLLHTRRAMAESVLLFTVFLFTWWLLKAVKNPWTLAFPAALAFNAKQSAAALALVAILAILISPAIRRLPARLLLNLGLFGLTFLAITAALNPFLWRDPVNAVQAAFQARQDLLTRQVEAMRRVAPNTVLDSLPQRAVSLVSNLYLVPLSFAEIGNYRADTLASEQQYLADPLNSIARDFLPGGILFFLSTCGFILGIVEAIRSRLHDSSLVWLILLTLVQTVAVLLAFQLPFQRYVIPVLPFTIFWMAFFFLKVIQAIQKKASPSVM